MSAESFRGIVASIVAAIITVGGPVAFVFCWLNATPDRELGLIFAAIGALTGSASTFLFLQDSASRASHASERASAAGASSQPTVTTSSGPPPTTTVTPPEPAAPEPTP